MKKIWFLLLLILFINVNFYTSSLGSSTIIIIKDLGSLSGYILDDELNPIQDAKILISCGENSFECYSNDSGFYHKEDIPIVFCIWNISVFKEGFNTAYCEMPIGKNSTCNFTLTAITIVDLNVEILAGVSFPTPLIRIENMGTGIATNVELSDVLIDGNVLYNNRDFFITPILEPEGIEVVNLNSWMIGFGIFTITVIVSCDEGVFVSEDTNGLIVGIIVFIP